MKIQQYILAVTSIVLVVCGCATKTDNAVAPKQDAQKTDSATNQLSEQQKTKPASNTNQSSDQQITKSVNNTQPMTNDSPTTKAQPSRSSPKQIPIADEKFKSPPITKEEISKILNTEVVKVDIQGSDERFPLFVYSGPSSVTVLNIRMIRGEFANSTFQDDKKEKGVEMITGLGDEALWNPNYNVVISHINDFSLLVNIEKDLPEKKSKAIEISKLVWEYLTKQ
jgi:hypothetical protein